MVRSTAGTIGGVATALAVFLPALVPTVRAPRFDLAGNRGGDDIRIDNPTADLVRDLRAATTPRWCR